MFNAINFKHIRLHKHFDVALRSTSTNLKIFSTKTFPARRQAWKIYDACGEHKNMKNKFTGEQRIALHSLHHAPTSDFPWR